MNPSKLSSFLSRFALPALLIVLGLLLLINPDSASAFVARILGYGLVAAGVVFAVAALTRPFHVASAVLGALMCLSLGVWLLRNPLALARGAGRLVGILLAIRGGQEVFSAFDTRSRLLALPALVLGIVLILLPMTTSRLLFSFCGGLSLVGGIVLLVYRLRQGPPSDPNIIDAL